jgi:hypothetical protein
MEASKRSLDVFNREGMARGKEQSLEHFLEVERHADKK